MAKKPPRSPSARADRRLAERVQRKVRKDRERLAARLPGGSPDHPMEISTPAVVEVRAAAQPCPGCGGNQTVEEHLAVVVSGEPLREARLACRLCHARRSIWFRLVPDRPN